MHPTSNSYGISPRRVGLRLFGIAEDQIMWRERGLWDIRHRCGLNDFKQLDLNSYLADKRSESVE